MKVRIEWDVAWRIFDHVNENNDIKKHIDLNCLDFNEAISIAKQHIYEIALNLKPYKPSVLCNCSGTPMSGEGVDYQVLTI